MAGEDHWHSLREPETSTNMELTISITFFVLLWYLRVAVKSGWVQPGKHWPFYIGCHQGQVPSSPSLCRNGKHIHVVNCTQICERGTWMEPTANDRCPYWVQGAWVARGRGWCLNYDSTVRAGNERYWACKHNICCFPTFDLYIKVKHNWCNWSLHSMLRILKLSIKMKFHSRLHAAGLKLS